jgi:hypothetical protein
MVGSVSREEFKEELHLGHICQNNMHGKAFHSINIT